MVEIETKLESSQYAVLFVCLGNICRSPLAIEIFRSLVVAQGLERRIRIDSCGTTGMHSGDGAHRGSLAIAKARGISLSSHRARQLHRDDFSKFDLIVAMDQENLRTLQSFPEAKSARIVLMRSYDSLQTSLDVPDPYFTGGFAEVYDIIHRSCEQLLHEVQKDLAV